MTPRTLPSPPNRLHVAIIMDGNGRWAVERGLPRSAGHRAGVEVVRRVVEAAPGLEIGTLTLYAFAAANWSRPVDEVGELLRLLEAYLRSQTAECVARDVRLDEGVTMLTNIVDCDLDSLKIGDRVKVCFKPADGDKVVPMFAPA